MARKVFYSFHYVPDNWRASQVRNIGKVEGNAPASDNDWEKIKGSEAKIKQWIDNQLKGRSCTVVLVGSNTANRKWINYEITESWNKGKGVVGIYIHGLKNQDGKTASKGSNPFDYISFKDGSKLSGLVKCYNPSGATSQEKYDWIKNNLENIIEEAIKNR